MMGTALLILISLPLINAGAVNGWITDIQIIQTPIDNETMHVKVYVSVRVEFNESGYYKVVVEDENGTELATSLSYKVGIPHTESTVPIAFDRPRIPGNYTYHILLQAKEDEANSWSIVAITILVFEVLPPPQGNTTNTTTNATTTSSVNQSRTQTVITGAYVITKNMTHTTTETVTRNITQTSTITTTVAITKYVERLKVTTVTEARAVTIRETETVTSVKTTTVFGIPKKLNSSNIIPIASIAGIFAFLLALLLWRRRGP